MSSFKIGLASVTFRNKTAEEIVTLCQKAGVEYIEWGADVHVKAPEDAKKVKALCDDAGIKISSYGSYCNTADFNENEWRQICENAHIMSASSIRIWLGKKDSEKTSEGEYRQLLSGAKRMCEIASEYGLLVCPECHDNTFNNNTDAIIRFKSDLQKDNFKTYFQSRYFRMEYDLDRIDRTYDFIHNVHVSYSDLKREQLFRKKDKNYLDTLLKKFISKGYEGIVILEFCEGAKEKNFFEDIKKLKSY